MIKPKLALLPFIFLALLLGFLWRGLSLEPKKIPSALTDKPVPIFNLPNLFKDSQPLSSKDLKGQVTMLHVFASWCDTCRQEHPIIKELAATDVPLYGLDYKDQDKAMSTWLKHLGNPYRKIGVDHEGSAALDWGVYGTPELFIIDKKGIVRYKHIGLLDKSTLKTVILPMLKQLKEAA